MSLKSVLQNGAVKISYYYYWYIFLATDISDPDITKHVHIKLRTSVLWLWFFQLPVFLHIRKMECKFIQLYGSNIYGPPYTVFCLAIIHNYSNRAHGSVRKTHFCTINNIYPLDDLEHNNVNAIIRTWYLHLLLPKTSSALPPPPPERPHHQHTLACCKNTAH